MKIVSIAQECRRRSLKGVQCTCSCYIELDPRAPPSWLQSEGEEGEQLVSQLFYSVLRHRQYCATSIAPTVLPPTLNLLLPPFYNDCAPEEARQVSRRRSCSFAPLESWWIVSFFLPSLLARFFPSPHTSRPVLTTLAGSMATALRLLSLFLSSFSLFRFQTFIFTSFIFRKLSYF